MSMDHEEELVQDDAVIGRAFRLSLGVIMTLVVAGLLLWFFLSRTAPEEEVVEATITGPRRADTSANVQPPVVLFADIAQSAGIDFVHRNGAYGEKMLPETMGSGAAFF